MLQWEPAGRRSATGWAGGGVRAEVAALAPSAVRACRRGVEHRPEVPGCAMVSVHRPPSCGRVGERWARARVARLAPSVAQDRRRGMECRSCFIRVGSVVRAVGLLVPALVRSLSVPPPRVR